MIPKKDNVNWDLKFLKEYPFMSFGSMCNSYGLVNHSKGISVEDFKKDMIELFELSNDFVKQQQLNNQEPEKPNPFTSSGNQTTISPFDNEL